MSVWARQQIQRTTQDLRKAEFDLSKMVDLSKFHVEIGTGAAKRALVYAGIPKGFKVALAGLISPAVVHINYIPLPGSAQDIKNKLKNFLDARVVAKRDGLKASPGKKRPQTGSPSL